MFYKIVIFLDETEQPAVLAFLFPHQRVVHRLGRQTAIPYFLVSVDLIEAMTGLDFFQGTEGEEVLESEDTWANWRGSNLP